MNDRAALIAELLEHAGWEEDRLNQACADVLRRAAEALKMAVVEIENLKDDLLWTDCA